LMGYSSTAENVAKILDALRSILSGAGPWAGPRPAAASQAAIRSEGAMTK